MGVSKNVARPAETAVTAAMAAIASFFVRFGVCPRCMTDATEKGRKR